MSAWKISSEHKMKQQWNSEDAERLGVDVAAGVLVLQPEGRPSAPLYMKSKTLNSQSFVLQALRSREASFWSGWCLFQATEELNWNPPFQHVCNHFLCWCEQIRQIKHPQLKHSISLKQSKSNYPISVHTHISFKRCFSGGPVRGRPGSEVLQSCWGKEDSLQLQNRSGWKNKSIHHLWKLESQTNVRLSWIQCCAEMRRGLQWTSFWGIEVSR